MQFLFTYVRTFLFPTPPNPTHTHPHHHHYEAAAEGGISEGDPRANPKCKSEAAAAERTPTVTYVPASASVYVCTLWQISFTTFGARVCTYLWNP